MGVTGLYKLITTHKLLEDTRSNVNLLELILETASKLFRKRGITAVEPTIRSNARLVGTQKTVEDLVLSLKPFRFRAILDSNALLGQLAGAESLDSRKLYPRTKELLAPLFSPCFLLRHVHWKRELNLAASRTTHNITSAKCASSKPTLQWDPLLQGWKVEWKISDDTCTVHVTGSMKLSKVTSFQPLPVTELHASWDGMPEPLKTATANYRRSRSLKEASLQYMRRKDYVQGSPLPWTDSAFDCPDAVREALMSLGAQEYVADTESDVQVQWLAKKLGAHAILTSDTDISLCADLPDHTHIVTLQTLTAGEAEPSSSFFLGADSVLGPILQTQFGTNCIGTNSIGTDNFPSSDALEKSSSFNPNPWLSPLESVPGVHRQLMRASLQQEEMKLLERLAKKCAANDGGSKCSSEDVCEWDEWDCVGLVLQPTSVVSLDNEVAVTNAAEDLSTLDAKPALLRFHSAKHATLSSLSFEARKLSDKLGHNALPRCQLGLVSLVCGNDMHHNANLIASMERERIGGAFPLASKNRYQSQSQSGSPAQGSGAENSAPVKTNPLSIVHAVTKSRPFLGDLKFISDMFEKFKHYSRPFYHPSFGLKQAVSLAGDTATLADEAILKNSLVTLLLRFAAEDETETLKNALKKLANSRDNDSFIFSTTRTDVVLRGSTSGSAPASVPGWWHQGERANSSSLAAPAQRLLALPAVAFLMTGIGRQEWETLSLREMDAGVTESLSESRNVLVLPFLPVMSSQHDTVRLHPVLLSRMRRPHLSPLWQSRENDPEAALATLHSPAVGQASLACARRALFSMGCCGDTSKGTPLAVPQVKDLPYWGGVVSFTPVFLTTMFPRAQTTVFDIILDFSAAVFIEFSLKGDDVIDTASFYISHKYANGIFWAENVMRHNVNSPCELPEPDLRKPTVDLFQSCAKVARRHDISHQHVNSTRPAQGWHLLTTDTVDLTNPTEAQRRARALPVPIRDELLSIDKALSDPLLRPRRYVASEGSAPPVCDADKDHVFLDAASIAWLMDLQSTFALPVKDAAKLTDEQKEKIRSSGIMDRVRRVGMSMLLCALSPPEQPLEREVPEWAKVSDDAPASGTLPWFPKWASRIDSASSNAAAFKLAESLQREPFWIHFIAGMRRLYVAVVQRGTLALDHELKHLPLAAAASLNVEKDRINAARARIATLFDVILLRAVLAVRVAQVVQGRFIRRIQASKHSVTMNDKKCACTQARDTGYSFCVRCLVTADGSAGLAPWVFEDLFSVVQTEGTTGSAARESVSRNVASVVMNSDECGAWMPLLHREYTAPENMQQLCNAPPHVWEHPLLALEAIHNLTNQNYMNMLSMLVMPPLRPTVPGAPSSGIDCDDGPDRALGLTLPSTLARAGGSYGLIQLATGLFGGERIVDPAKSSANGAHSSRAKSAKGSSNPADTDARLKEVLDGAVGPERLKDDRVSLSDVFADVWLSFAELRTVFHGDSLVVPAEVSHTPSAEVSHTPSIRAKHSTRICVSDKALPFHSQPITISPCIQKMAQAYETACAAAKSRIKKGEELSRSSSLDVADADSCCSAPVLTFYNGIALTTLANDMRSAFPSRSDAATAGKGGGGRHSSKHHGRDNGSGRGNYKDEANKTHGGNHVSTTVNGSGDDHDDGGWTAVVPKQKYTKKQSSGRADRGGASNTGRGGASNTGRGGASNTGRGGASNTGRGGASNAGRGGASNAGRGGNTGRGGAS